MVQITLPNGDVISVEGVASEDTLQSIQKMLAKSANVSSSSGDLGKNTKNLNESLKNLNKNFSNSTENIDDLTDSAKNAADNIDDLIRADKKASDERIKSQKEFNQTVNKITTVSIENFGKSIQSSTLEAVKGFSNLFHGSNDASTGINTASTLLNTGIGLANQGVQTVTSAGSALGGALMNTTGPAKLAGVALSGLSVAASMASNVLTGALQFANNFLATEFIKTSKSFSDMSAAGAIFADGLTGMRKAAGEAQVTLDVYSSVVAKNSLALAQAGAGVADGAKQLGKITSSINTQGLRDQLLKLGFSYQDQADLAAQYMSDLVRSGTLRSKSDMQIAKETAQYAESLKIISAITGDDAKKRQDEARAQSMQIAVQNKLRDLEADSPGIAQRFNATLATMPAELRKGFVEQFVTGGAVVDQTTNVLMAQIPQIKTTYDNLNSIIKDSSLTTDQSTIATAKSLGDLNQAFNNSRDSMNTLGTAALLGVTGPAANTSAALTALSIDLNNFTKDGVNVATKAVQDGKDTQDVATKSFIDLTKQVNTFNLVLQEITTQALPSYSRILGESVKAMVDTFQKAGIQINKAIVGGIMPQQTWLDKQWEKIKNAQGTALSTATIGAGIGAATGATAGGVGALPGAVIGGGVGYLSGLFSSLAEQSFAAGGIANGPTTGYAATLHGTEAVVPLPNNKSIPVSINLAALASSLTPKDMSADLKTAIITGMEPLTQATQYIASQQTVQPTVESQNDLLDALNQQCSYLKTFVDKAESILSTLEDQKNISQQILNQGY